MEKHDGHVHVDEVEASGGTSINDHLFMALTRLESVQGRRVVVLFSDGADVHSVLSMAEVLSKASSSQALIYWIHLREPGEPLTAPGQLLSHYAPDASVRLNAESQQGGEVLLGFGEVVCDMNLSPDGNLNTGIPGR